MSVRLRPRAGISLLTVLAGLFVIGFLAVVAIPGYFNRHDVTLENACRLVSRDLRTLQNRAALDKLTVRMVFDSDGWRALDANDKPVAGIGESYPIVRRFEGEGVFAGVVIERIDLGGDNELAIDRRGVNEQLTGGFAKHLQRQVDGGVVGLRQVQLVDRLLEVGGGVGVRAESKALALQHLHHLAFRDALRSVEGHMLKEVSEPELGL